LTNRSLLSVIKYNNKHNDIRYKTEINKFLYDEDYDMVKNICNENKVNVRTIDTQIMELADEIAYSAHDLEDALSINLFSIDEFLFELKKDRDADTFDKLYCIVSDVRKVDLNAEIYDSSEEYSFLFRKELISNIVNQLIEDIGVVKVSDEFKEETGTSNEYELNFKTKENLAKGLKK